MRNFTYIRATSVQEALSQSASPESMYVAGGTNLLDRMKGFLDEPAQLIDVSRLNFTGIDRMPNGGWQIGAMVTNTALADHPDIRRDYPLLSRAILSGASQQIRNAATVGGNLLQRTRCPYYYDAALACNKRKPGTGCPAATGSNRMHAIFGASSQCVAVHPSDLCVALAALDAVVEVEGTQGKRQIPFAEFHRLPEDTPQNDTNLAAGELITRLMLPPLPMARSGVYLKLRDRTSYAFALVSVAALVDVSGGQIREARLAMGGVAHKPWRLTAAEQFLKGKAAETATFEQAAELALQGAQPLTYNAFKVDMSKRAIRRALSVSVRGGGLV